MMSERAGLATRCLRRISLCIVIPCAFVMLSGCAPLIFFGAGTAAGVAGYKFYDGALNVIYQASYMDTWDAALKALSRMNLKVEKSDHDLKKGEIVARRPDGTRVTLSIEYKSPNETEAVIRVGFFGDEPASVAIKEKIREILQGVS
jgi:Protein of unknown function (DUF3568)